MEAVLGGLSGGGCSWCNEISLSASFGRTEMLWASLVVGGTNWARVVRNIEFGCRTSFWQQECEFGMFIEPHLCAIRLQQSCSAAVISTPGVRQAIAG